MKEPSAAVLELAPSPDEIPPAIVPAPAPAPEALPVARLHADARAQLAGGDLKAGFHAYRQLLASASIFTEAEDAAISSEMAPLVPRWLEQATPGESEAFRRALGLHRPLVLALVLASERHAVREAALLTFALSSVHAVNNDHSVTVDLLRGVPNPEIVSPDFEVSFNELKDIATVGTAAKIQNGWAANLTTPYPLMPDGKPKLKTVWLEVTSFCNQKCSFCPDQWREGKRQSGAPSRLAARGWQNGLGKKTARRICRPVALNRR